MQWFRLYSEFSTDPKVQMMSEEMQRRLVMLFCIKSSDTEIDSSLEVSFLLRITPEQTEETKSLFIEKGFIDDEWSIINWDKRQYISDDSNARVKKYRDKRKAMGLAINGYTKHHETVTRRDGNKCVYCGSNENLCLDHILPIDLGGMDDIQNLATACKSCNSGKSGRTPNQAGYEFLNKKTEKIWNDWMDNRVTVSVTVPDTEQKQIQNRTESEEEALSLYNQFADANGFARVQKLTVTRKGKLQARLKDCGGIEGWHTALQKMAQSNFCRGSNDRGWKADFDFLVTEGSFVKLMEGKYDNNKPEDKFKSQVKELAQNGW